MTAGKPRLLETQPTLPAPCRERARPTGHVQTLHG
jgi:hypothetical protein